MPYILTGKSGILGALFGHFGYSLRFLATFISLPARGGENAFLDVSLDVGLGVVAFLAQDKLLDETIQHVLKLKIVNV